MGRQQVHLRSMTAEDTPKIVAWRNRDFVRRNFIYQKPLTPKEHLRWIREQVEPGHVVQFIICLADGREIGSVYFRDIDREACTAEYGIFIGEADALGCGYGSQTAKLALQYAFETLRLRKVFLRFLEGNEGAHKSYENAGFQMMRDKQETVLLKQGRRKVFFMEIDREAWLKRQAGIVDAALG